MVHMICTATGYLILIYSQTVFVLSRLTFINSHQLFTVYVS